MAFLSAGAGTAAAAPVPAPPLDAACAGLAVPGLVVFVLTDSNGLSPPAREMLGVVNAPFGCHDEPTRRRSTQLLLRTRGPAGYGPGGIGSKNAKRAGSGGRGHA